MISEITRQKMRDAKLKNPTRYWLGKTNPGFEALKIWRLNNPAPKPWLGKKRPEIKNWLNGARDWNQTEEVKRRISETHTGPNHYRWSTNREEVRQDRRSDGEYKQWRKNVYKRDEYKCKIANLDCSGKIEAHHILSWKEFKELRYEINNGITLCRAHHPRGRVQEKKKADYLQSLIPKC